VLAETGEGNTRSVKMLEKLGFSQRRRFVSFMKEM